MTLGLMLKPPMDNGTDVGVKVGVGGTGVLVDVGGTGVLVGVSVGVAVGCATTAVFVQVAVG